MAFQYKGLNDEQLEKIKSPILGGTKNGGTPALEPIKLGWVDLPQDELDEIQVLEKELGSVLGVFKHD